MGVALQDSGRRPPVLMPTWLVRASGDVGQLVGMPTLSESVEERTVNLPSFGQGTQKSPTALPASCRNSPLCMWTQLTLRHVGGIEGGAALVCNITHPYFDEGISLGFGNRRLSV